MKDDKVIFDGHTRIIGVDTNTDPAELAPGMLAGAVNRAFRGGTNKTRPGFHSKTLVFSDPTDQTAFQQGAIQGAIGYTAVSNGAVSQIVVAVNDRILGGVIQGDNIVFSRIHSGIDPTLMHSWFVQVQDRIYWQNGTSRPVGWDGVNPSYIVPNVDNSGMPVGTFMVFIQGRLAVFTTDNYCIISDNIYGNGITNTRGVESFIEWQQFNDIGAIASYTQFGNVTGAIAIPLPQTINGQGQLLVMQERGAFTLDLSGARSTWLTGGIQTIVLQGRGSASFDGLVPCNNDVWYAASDGSVSSYNSNFSQVAGVWGNVSLSREVQYYLNFTAPALRQFMCGVKSDNRLLMSCAIQSTPCLMGGAHRYGLGMVSLDFDLGSTTMQKSGFAWDGLWTGPRPCAMAQLTVDGGLRTFILSHDADGINRIYEQDDDSDVDIVDGKVVKIISQYTTQYLFGQKQQGERPVIKTLNGATGIVSDLIRSAEISIDFRPNYNLEWSTLMPSTALGCDNIPSDATLPDVTPNRNFGPRYKPFQSPTVNPECETGENRLTFKAYQHQLRVRMTGAMSVPFLQAKSTPQKDVKDTTCGDSDGMVGCQPILLPGFDLFEYQLPGP